MDSHNKAIRLDRIRHWSTHYIGKVKGRSLGQRIIYIAQNFLIQELKLAVIISGEFVVSV